MAVIGDPQAPIGVQALEALGLTAKHCAGLTIEFRPNEIVVVRAQYYSEEGGIEKVIRVLEGLRKPV